MFDPKDLYTFSDKILGFYYSEEAARRSVVSRSYYAVFLILREKLRVSHPSEVHDDPTDHANIVHALRRRGYSYEAQKCFDLKDERHTADYKLQIPCTEGKANEVLLDAKELIEDKIPAVNF